MNLRNLILEGIEEVTPDFPDPIDLLTGQGCRPGVEEYWGEKADLNIIKNVASTYYTLIKSKFGTEPFNTVSPEFSDIAKKVSLLHSQKTADKYDPMVYQDYTDVLVDAYWVINVRGEQGGIGHRLVNPKVRLTDEQESETFGDLL